MGPERRTPERLLPVLDELREREPLFHHRRFGTSVEATFAQTDPDFWEVGASGRRYSRQYVAETRANAWASGPEPWEGGGWSTSDFCCQELGADLYLLTYTSQEPDRLTRRCTIWKRGGPTGWLIVFHQGTIVA